MHKRRRAQSQLSAVEHLRSSSKYTPLPSSNIPMLFLRKLRYVFFIIILVTAYCAHCKLPLLIDLTARETNNKSRASVQ